MYQFSEANGLVFEALINLFIDYFCSFIVRQPKQFPVFWMNVGNWQIFASLFTFDVHACQYKTKTGISYLLFHVYNSQ